MISRDLELRINNNSATLKEPVTVYMYDRGIQLNITIKEYKFRIGQNSTENYLEANNIYKASAIIKSPDGKVFKYPTVKTTVSNNVVHLLITKEWTDESDEAGRYYIQIQLFDDDNSRVSLPPFYITVEKLIFPYDDKQDGDTSGYVDVSGFDSSVIGLEGATKDESDLSKGFYDRTTWKENMLITSSGLNKLETRLDEIYSGDGFRETEITSYNTTAKTTMGAINELKALLATLQGEINDFILNNSGIPGTPGGGGTPQEVPIESINILNNALTLVPGGNPVALTCTVLPYNYTEDLIWSTSNDSVAIVDNTGKVFAVGSGTVIITCKSSGNNSIYDTITVTVNAESTLVPITGITITSVMEDISIGIPTQIECTVEPEGYTSKLIWTSSNTDIATVDQFGVVTGKAPGDVVIICRSSTNSDIKAELSVTIAEPYTPLQKITLNPASFEVNRGEKYRVAYALTPSNTTEKSVYWYSEDQSIASVDQNGIVTGVGPGETTIRCVSTINSELYGSTTVTSIVKIEDLDIVSESNTIEKGKTLQLGVEYIPADTNQRNIRWISSDDTIATVDENGLVTAHTAGNVSITCTSEHDENIHDEFNLDVIIHISSIEFDKTSLVINKGETATINYTLYPEDVTEKDVYWTSSDESIATVDENGLVTTLKGGFVKIRCASVHDNSVYNECEIESFVSLENLIITCDEGDSGLLLDRDSNLQLKLTYIPEDTTERDIEWISSNEEIVTVDKNGLVTSKAKGDVIISCKSTIKPEIEATFNISVMVFIKEINLSSSMLKIDRGASQTITAELVPSDTFQTEVVWEVIDKDTGLVEITDNSLECLINAVEKGNVTVRCKSVLRPEIYKDCEVKVIVIPKEIIFELNELESSKGHLHPNETFVIQYSFIPEDATETDVIWSSSNDNLIKVDNGVVTAVGNVTGSTTITCTSVINSLVTKSCNVELKLPIEEIILSDSSLVLDRTDSQVITAALSPIDTCQDDVIWEIVGEGNKYIEIEPDGLNCSIRANAIGNAIVRCKSKFNESIYAECSVEVIVLPANIILATTDEPFYVTQTRQIRHTFIPSDSTVRDVVWSSSNSSIATVDENGLVTAVGKGEVTITCTSVENILNKPRAVASHSYIINIGSVEITNSLPERVDKGQQITLIAKTFPTDNIPVIWSSSNNSIATVDENGIVTVIGNSGEFNIVCTIQGDDECFDISNTCTINVYPTGISIITDVESAMYYENHFNTIKLDYMLIPENCNVEIDNTIEFSCTDDNVIIDESNVFKFSKINESGFTINARLGEFTSSLNIECKECDIVIETTNNQADFTFKVNNKNYYATDSHYLGDNIYGYINSDIESINFSVSSQYHLKRVLKLNTGNVTDMSYMFKNCTKLESIPQLDTSNVTNMKGMFTKCASLTTIPQLDTSNVTNMKGMFTECASLTTIPQLDTSNVTDMSYMFKTCRRLEDIPELLNTGSVVNMSWMFSECISLSVIPQFDTSNVTNMSYMFDCCNNVESIPQLDTSNVTDMKGMFNKCSFLRTIPELNTGNVTDMSYMFTECVWMSGSADPDKYWNNPSVTVYTGCFNGCIRLSNYRDIPSEWVNLVV